MCGIAGWINVPGISDEQLLASLRHRGPDTQSITKCGDVTLAHTRLAIQDINHAHQPMRRGDSTLVYNGEIYNHMALRSELREFDFVTTSDTETLLYLLIKFKEKALPMLDGMFAFAFHDAKSKRLLLGRDRAGEKPLYYYHHHDQLLFASELNTLKQQIDLKADETQIAAFLRLGFFYRDTTPYEHVSEFPPASYAWLDTGSPELLITPYWSIETAYLQSLSDDFNTDLSHVDDLLQKSVSARLENSDLEVGTFMSGGIDSGLITAMAAKQQNRLRTFTVSFDGTYNEAPLAKMVADHCHTDHTELSISFDSLQNDLEHILANYGEPFADSSAIPSYYVAKAAKEHINVILTGDGADELFGGYRRYVPFKAYDFFSLPAPLRAAAFAASTLLPKSHHKKSLYNHLTRLIKLASQQGVSQYLSTTTDIFEGFTDMLGQNSSLEALTSRLNEISALPLDGLQKLMLLDFETILSGDLLVKIDIATMAHSLEARSPFLNKELLDVAPAIASAHKINGKSTKYLLRELAKQYLPETIVTQPKRGFEIPLKQWVNNELSDLIADTLVPGCYASNFIEPSWFGDLLADKTAVPAEQRAKMIWSLLSLQIWYNKVYRA
jgi:asparagine synthase (glutamine-hydrolysing)